MRTIILSFLLASSICALAQSIGIGTNSPQARLHIKGDQFPNSFIYLESNAGQDAGFRLYEGAIPKWHIFNQSVTGGLHIYNNAVQTALFASQATGYVGIGTTTPAARLDVNGQLKISGGSPGAGKVLTSDAAGLASWISLPAAVLTLPYAGTCASAQPAFSVTNSGVGYAISGIASSTGGSNLVGVYGESASAFGIGVDGNTTNPNAGLKMGVRGVGRTDGAIGVYGLNNAETGVTYGVRGTVFSDDGYAGYFTGGKFYVEGKVGIGTNAPSRVLTIKTATGISSANFVNDASGTISTDGLMVGLTGTLSASLLNYENGALNIGTNNSPQINILANGDIGIGTLLPAYKLDVAGEINLNKGIASGIAMYVNGDEALWYNNTYFSWGYGGTYNVFIDPVGINCSPGDGHYLAVNGIASKPGGGSWAAFSDGRLKDLHGDYTRGLDDIIELNPVLFNYKQNNSLKLPSDQEYVGFVAQEVQKVFPETIRQTPSGYLEFDMHAVNVAMVNALKELKAENDALKKSNQQLLQRLEKIEKLLGAKPGQ